MAKRSCHSVEPRPFQVRQYLLYSTDILLQHSVSRQGALKLASEYTKKPTVIPLFLFELFGQVPIIQTHPRVLSLGSYHNTSRTWKLLLFSWPPNDLRYTPNLIALRGLRVNASLFGYSALTSGANAFSFIQSAQCFVDTPSRIHVFLT